MSKSFFIDTINGKTTSRPFGLVYAPGRQGIAQLPEAARAAFVELMHSPKLAAEVTLMPVYDLGVDAAILFSDILVIPAALGMNLNFTDSRSEV